MREGEKAIRGPRCISGYTQRMEKKTLSDDPVSPWRKKKLGDRPSRFDR